MQHIYIYIYLVDYDKYEGNLVAYDRYEGTASTGRVSLGFWGLGFELRRPTRIRYGMDFVYSGTFTSRGILEATYIMLDACTSW